MVTSPSGLQQLLGINWSPKNKNARMIIKKRYHIRCQLFHNRNKAIIFMTNLLVALVDFYFDINSYISTTIQENCLKRVRFHSKLIRTKPVFVLSNLCLPFLWILMHNGCFLVFKKMRGRLIYTPRRSIPCIKCSYRSLLFWTTPISFCRWPRNPRSWHPPTPRSTSTGTKKDTYMYK